MVKNPPTHGLIDRVREELWTKFRDLRQQAVIKTIPNGCLRSLTNSYEKKRGEKQRRKGKIYPFECRVPKNSKKR